jgi:hypothetical protein
VGPAPYAVVGDFNGDGISDLATADFNGNSVTVLLGAKASTSSTLSTTSPLTITSGQSVPLTLAVSDTGTAFNAPTGTATFSDGATALGSASQTSSPYTFSASSLGVGSHTLTASYGGDARSLGSTSSSITITVNPGACTYTLSPTSVSLPGSAVTGSVSVTTQAGCTWTATSNQTWLTVTSGASGVGNGTVDYSAAVNSGVSRSATLAIAGQSFPVIQAPLINFVLYSTTYPGSGTSPNSLLTVATSGAQQLVGQPGQAASLLWLTANPVDSLLYGTGPGGSTLYTINPNSGAISGTVTLSQSVGAIAASAQGTLYGLSGNTLGTINTATGQFSSVGTVSLAPGYNLEGMAFSPGGTLYAVTVTFGTFDQQLITLDPATGAVVSDLGSLGGLDVGDITYAPDGNIYGTNFSYYLLKIDPQTLSNTAVGNGTFGGLGGIAAISVPSTTLNGFQGGSASSPISLPSGTPVTGVTGTISGTGSEEYYELSWPGGPFSATAAITSTPNSGASYLFSLGVAGSCNSLGSATLNANDSYIGTITSSNLSAGNYCIGIDANDSSDPTFAITFSTPVTGTTLSCNVTGNTTVGVADVQLIISEALGVAQPANDLNADRVVNVTDVEIVLNAALGQACLAGSVSTALHTGAVTRLPAAGPKGRER